ncbi:MAG: aldo/keto reductase [Xanthobacteraceae bacterium]|nr:aldo/keto reductase [Xanthobacteraceae bacterium]
MTQGPLAFTRRALVGAAGALGAAAALPRGLAAAPGPVHLRPIPSTGEEVPAIGMGTWITFNVSRDPRLRAGRLDVFDNFFAMGGRLVDSSPMYGSSEEVVGYCRAQRPQAPLFSATKVWTMFRAMGVRQMEASRTLWGVAPFDLMQIHNMLDWETHLATLKDWKAQGRVRLIGITTSHGRRHDDLAAAMAREPFDAVQFTYNIVDREAEKRLLPLAAERRQAVIVNRPFREGALIDHVKRHPLPPFAAEIDCTNWAQFLLKFIISHPAVTCAIPATSRADHMRENMGALTGRLPDAQMRARMIRHVEGL